MVCIGRLTPSTSALVPQHIKVVIEESSLMYAGPSFTSLQYIEFILTSENMNVVNVENVSGFVNH